MDSKYKKLILILVITVAVDQITKTIISGYIPIYDSVSVIPNFFSLTHVRNPGGAFGFLADRGIVIRIVVFLFAACAAACIVLYFFMKTPKTHKFLQFGFSLILGGAMGNIIDRFRFGEVVDFLDFYIGRHRWPAFNAADIFINIGLAIFAYHIIFKKLPE